MPLYDLFPWNISSPAAFLCLYLVVTAATALGVRALARRWLALRGGHAVQAVGEGPYRAAATGALRTIDDALALAHLRAGDAGVRDAILAVLAAAGVLTSKDGTLVLSDGAASDPAVKSLQAALVRTGAGNGRSVVDGASSLARARRDGYVERLAQAGLHPTREQRARARRLGDLAAAAVAAFGVVRLARGVSLGHPVGFLLVEILVAPLVVAAMGRVIPRSAVATQHLDTVAASALPAAVRARRLATPAPLDAAIASAALGVAAGPVVLDVLQVASALVAPQSGDGGGGCGGGGCGGGGCGGGCGG